MSLEPLAPPAGRSEPATREQRRERRSTSRHDDRALTGLARQLEQPVAPDDADEAGIPTPATDSPVVLVTGGAQGLGAAIVEAFAVGGMRVVVADVRGATARERAEAVDPSGENVASVELDVADCGSAIAAVDATIERFGRLDVLVNNAGIDLTKPFEEIDDAAFDHILDVNLRGPINMTRVALPALRESGRGMIFNIVSTAAKRAWPNASAYHASKWGLLGFSHAMHAELRPQGIRVTAVICGGMRTPFILERFPDTPLENLQDPANVARTLRCLVEADHDSVVPEISIMPLGETSWP
jgi:NAD(P)-dependent dehydrogenase (short-subunit alcohol dehydrogenase family)